MSLPKKKKKKPKSSVPLTWAKFAYLQGEVERLSAELIEARDRERLARDRDDEAWILVASRMSLFLEIRGYLQDLRDLRHEIPTIGASQRALKLLDELALKGSAL